MPLPIVVFICTNETKYRTVSLMLYLCTSQPPDAKANGNDQVEKAGGPCSSRDVDEATPKSGRGDKTIQFEIEDSNDAALDVLSDDDMNAETAEGSSSSSSDEANEENETVYDKLVIITADGISFRN